MAHSFSYAIVNNFINIENGAADTQGRCGEPIPHEFPQETQ